MILSRPGGKMWIRPYRRKMWMRPYQYHIRITLFKNSESCVMNNGFSTGYFALEIGTYLFIFALEVMFIQVRSNVDIAGVKIGGHSVKLSAYADDTYFFTLDINSLRHILNICDKFD